MARRTAAKAAPYNGVKFSLKGTIKCSWCGVICADSVTRYIHERFCDDVAARRAVMEPQVSNPEQPKPNRR